MPSRSSNSRTAVGTRRSRPATQFRQYQHPHSSGPGMVMREYAATVASRSCSMMQSSITSRCSITFNLSPSWSTDLPDATLTNSINVAPPQFYTTTPACTALGHARGELAGGRGWRCRSRLARHVSHALGQCVYLWPIEQFLLDRPETHRPNGDSKIATRGTQANPCHEHWPKDW